jgi:hypothetical protein
LQALFGKRPTKKDPAKGTSSAIDFTLKGPGPPQGGLGYLTAGSDQPGTCARADSDRATQQLAFVDPPASQHVFRAVAACRK